MELVVIRASADVPLHLTMVVEEATSDKLYRYHLLLISSNMLMFIYVNREHHFIHGAAMRLISFFPLFRDDLPSFSMS